MCCVTPLLVFIHISFTTYIRPGLRCSIKKLRRIKHYNEPAVENRPCFCENLMIYSQDRWKASMDLSISTHLHRRHHKFLAFASPQSFFSRFAQADTHPNLFYPLRPAKLWQKEPVSKTEGTCYYAGGNRGEEYPWDYVDIWSGERQMLFNFKVGQAISVDKWAF